MEWPVTPACKEGAGGLQLVRSGAHVVSHWYMAHPRPGHRCVADCDELVCMAGTLLCQAHCSGEQVRCPLVDGSHLLTALVRGIRRVLGLLC